MSFLKRSGMSLFLLSIPAFANSSVPGITNFYQVDDHVYRGAQPNNEGFQYLAKIGIKTVLDLQEADNRAAEEKSSVSALGMQYVNVPMTGLTPPTQAEISKILALLEDTTGGPVFVHCHRGADRTGAVIAAYRIDHNHWDSARALKEAVSDGMGMFQFPRKDYIRTFHPLTLEAKSGSNPVEANASAATAAAMAMPLPIAAR
jgi:tyrosine-protein phosphatase SIW14